VCLVWCLLPASAIAGQNQASVQGAVADPLGARVPGATVTLAGERQPAPETTSTGEGAYTFPSVAAGRYQIVVKAAGFETYTSEPFYVSGTSQQTVDVTLQLGPLQQAVTVTASASEVPQSQTGAPVTVLDSRTIDALNKPDVLESLRLVPGSQILQTGARGGNTSMFLRGGASDFNKVLVDGVAVNDIGGAFDFAQLSTTGIERVEVLRQTNSVMYGSDALAGVVAITTMRGRTPTPEAVINADGGNLGTYLTGGGIGGVVKRFDYYSAYSRFHTDNNVPNNEFTNGTYSGRFGVALGHGSDLTGTLRRTDTEAGNPNAISLFGIADDSSQKNELTYATLTARSQITNRWQTTVRFGSSDQTSHFLNPSPSGEPFDPFGFGANYIGNTVTVTGANGYSATGRGILDFSGTYPQPFDSRATRRLVTGDTSYEVGSALLVSGGARYEREQAIDVATGDATTTRNNAGGFVEARLTLMNRHYVTGGLGVEHNAVFGNATTPRLSIASYLRNPTASAIGDTKVVLNAGTGIKAPSVFQEESSLLELVKGTPSAAGVGPIGPERSRSFDIGIEQGLASGRARVRVSYFHNTFDDLIEFLDKTTLPRAGVPVDVANATAFGAYVNSQSYRAQGVETSFDAALAHGIRLMASYTRLNAEVTAAFSASESFNDAFPGIPIGAFSPLVGQRPFRHPPNSGTLAVIYAPGRAELALSTYFSGRRDDSTFLNDEFFGNSLLLPNRDLDASYQKVDLSASYQVHPRLRGYVSIENLLDQDYEAAFGFPALPITARVGFKVTFGGNAAP
jgi:iron complex outermembrane receptor protein/vitamin B12 transporter